MPVSALTVKNDKYGRAKGFGLLELLFVILIICVVYVLSMQQRRLKGLHDITIRQYMPAANTTAVQDPYANADRH